jgi:hypothetical protein
MEKNVNIKVWKREDGENVGHETNMCLVVVSAKTFADTTKVIFLRVTL